jgi:hypothetical protein
MGEGAGGRIQDKKMRNFHVAFKTVEEDMYIELIKHFSFLCRQE